MTSDERQFLIETLCEDLIPMIMEEYNLSDKEAIEDPDTGLYYQSPVYVFDFLKDEFNAAGIEH